ncbi:hypothetical protein EDD22DRAFT_964471 [Suillus occidentalis]|nr:hypothetical protein EDD22DRAFT_964471 [Suillus occidentalis]
MPGSRLHAGPPQDLLPPPLPPPPHPPHPPPPTTATPRHHPQPSRSPSHPRDFTPPPPPDFTPPPPDFSQHPHHHRLRISHNIPSHHLLPSEPTHEDLDNTDAEFLIRASGVIVHTFDVKWLRMTMHG